MRRRSLLRAAGTLTCGVALALSAFSCAVPVKEETHESETARPTQKKERPELIGTAPERTPYFKLEPDEKHAFLPLYPCLSTDERKASVLRPSEFRENWEKSHAWSAERGCEIDPKLIEGLEIEPLPRLKAFLRYQNGKRVEATSDTEFMVGPPKRVEMTDGHLKSRCSSLPISITASFLDVASKSLELESPSPIDRLELSPDEALAEPLAAGRPVAFKLIAFCRDGTSGDVSCEADWDTSPKGFEINSCGRLSTPPNGPAHDSVRVRARLSGREATVLYNLKR